MQNVETILTELEKSLPPIFARKEVSKLTGGLVAPHTLANADSLGKGPNGRLLIGRHTAYNRNDFIAWLRTRIKPAMKNETTARSPKWGFDNE